MRAIDVLGRVYDLPPAARARALSIGIPFVIPIARGLRLRVDDVNDRRAQLTMPFTRRASNHIGTVYLGALMVLAEATMASLVVGLCRPPRFRVLVKRSEADFVARADGSVRAVCAPADLERAPLDAVARGEGEARAEATLSVGIDAVDSGARVCAVRFLVSVKRA